MHFGELNLTVVAALRARHDAKATLFLKAA